MKIQLWKSTSKSILLKYICLYISWQLGLKSELLRNPEIPKLPPLPNMCFPEKNLGGEMMHVWALLDLVLVVKGLWKGTGLLKSKVSFFRRYHKARHILIFREVFYLKKKVERQWNVFKIGVLTSTILYSVKKPLLSMQYDYEIWISVNFQEINVFWFQSFSDYGNIIYYILAADYANIIQNNCFRQFFPVPKLKK